MSGSAADRTTTASGLTIAGFVVSIVGVLLSLLGAGFIPGVVALVLVLVGRRRERSSLNTAGLVLSVIAIVLSVVIVAVRVISTGSGTV